MEIIETSFYTKSITKLFTDEEYQKLQNYLVQYPKSGDVIKGSGGLRKLRWELKNKGKSGGVRNIYYYFENKDTILMVFVYEKNKKDNLTQKEINILKQIIQED